VTECFVARKSLRGLAVVYWSAIFITVRYIDRLRILRKKKRLEVSKIVKAKRRKKVQGIWNPEGTKRRDLNVKCEIRVAKTGQN
jgi:hypothetical protein